MTEHFLSARISLSYINQLPVLRINNDRASATISVQGAQVLEFTPAGGDNLLFVAQGESFNQGEAIRGGIPICWPWFGAHPELADAPTHGLAREVDWQYKVVADSDNRTDLLFWLDLDGRHPAFPYPARAELLVSIGSSLVVSLTTLNLGPQPFQLSQALHTYFACQDQERVRIQGLADRRYLDKLTGKNGSFPRAFSFDREIDWVVADVGQALLFSGLGQKAIHMTRLGSRSVVLWNPGREKSKTLSHFLPDEYRGMFCVEASNALEDCRLIKANSNHVLVMELTAVDLDAPKPA
ncbi:MAG: glucose-6-phosphate 1-epimerase [Reinekea sp.]|jgi:glucose-6-phosphate 1-epimerase